MKQGTVARDRHQEKLMEAAPSLGIVVEDLLPSWKLDAVRYWFQGESRLVLDGRSYPSLTANAETICNNKHVTKDFLKMVGVPFPKSLVFEVGAGELEAQLASIGVWDFLKTGRKYVCKPLYGTDGHAVGMNFTDPSAVMAHLQSFSGQYLEWMLEEEVEGEDLRIQVIGGQLVAACKRIPATVTGDGQHTLQELIDLHNVKIHSQNPHNVLEVDSVSVQLMAAQRVDLADVVADGRPIQLKLVSNMGQGGIAIDVTGRLHPQYAVWARELSRAIGIRTFAFDLICKDPSKDPMEAAQALELNPRAQWLHHTFSEVQEHDIPTMILKDLFLP